MNTDANNRFDECYEWPDELPDDMPVQPAAQGPPPERQSQAKAKQPPKGTHRAIDALNARLAVDAFAVPTPEEMAAIESVDGLDLTVYDPPGFVDADFRVDFIVDRVLVEKQPCGVAGPSKSLKTSGCLDLAVSLATGTPFFNTFAVNAAKRVLFLSAESGLGVIRCTASRICRARQVSLSEVPIHWGGWVPRVKFVRQLAALRSAIKRSQAEVVFIDPLYQAIDGTDAANVALMGQQLKDICDQVLHFDATPVLVHHSTKTSVRVLNREPLEIHDLAGAGVTEFFRQWVLLNRREAFSPETPHRLWLSAGGSAGHASHFALDIDEERDEQSICHGWNVTLQRGEDARQEAAQEAAKRKATAKQQTTQATRKQHVDDVLAAFRSVGSAGLTKTGICERTGLNNGNAGFAIATLLREQAIEECEVEKTGRKYAGYRRTNEKSNKSDKSDKTPELSGLSE